MDQPVDFPKPAGKTVRECVDVPVDKALLRLAVTRAGIDDAGELVAFAVRILADADPSAVVERDAAGSLPDLELDI